MYNRTDFSAMNLIFLRNLNLHHGMLTLEESWHELKHHLLMARELYLKSQGKFNQNGLTQKYASNSTVLEQKGGDSDQIQQ